LEQSHGAFHAAGKNGYNGARPYYIAAKAAALKGLSEKNSISRPERRRQRTQGRAGAARPGLDMDKGDSLGYAIAGLPYRGIRTRTLYEHSNT